MSFLQKSRKFLLFATKYFSTEFNFFFVMSDEAGFQMIL